MPRAISTGDARLPAMVTPDRLRARAALVLPASPAGACVTGATLVVDGGHSLAWL